MSEEVSDLRRQLSMMTTRLHRVEASSRQTWLLAPTGGGAAATTALYRIVAGNVLPSIPGLGIARRTDNVSASELPNGLAGTGIIIVPANPGTPGLPNGVGVAQRVDTGGYVWVLNDATLATNTPDLQYGDIVEQATSINLDKVSGGTTWRYTCLQPISGWWG